MGCGGSRSGRGAGTRDFAIDSAPSRIGVLKARFRGASPIKMPSPELLQVVKPLEDLHRKFLVAIGWAVALLTLLAQLLAPGGQKLDLADPIFVVLVLGAFCTVALALALPRLLLTDATLRRHVRADPESPASAAADSPFPLTEARREAFEALIDRERRLARAANLHLAPWLVGAGLAGTLPLYGLALAIHGHPPALSLALAAVSAALLILRRPKLSAHLARAERFLPESEPGASNS